MSTVLYDSSEDPQGTPHADGSGVRLTRFAAGMKPGPAVQLDVGDQYITFYPEGWERFVRMCEAVGHALEDPTITKLRVDEQGTVTAERAEETPPFRFQLPKLQAPSPLWCTAVTARLEVDGERFEKGVARFERLEITDRGQEDRLERIESRVYDPRHGLAAAGARLGTLEDEMDGAGAHSSVAKRLNKLAQLGVDRHDSVLGRIETIEGRASGQQEARLRWQRQWEDEEVAARVQDGAWRAEVLETLGALAGRIESLEVVLWDRLEEDVAPDPVAPEVPLAVRLATIRRQVQDSEEGPK